MLHSNIYIAELLKKGKFEIPIDGFLEKKKRMIRRTKREIQKEDRTLHQR